MRALKFIWQVGLVLVGGVFLVFALIAWSIEPDPYQAGSINDYVVQRIMSGLIPFGIGLILIQLGVTFDPER